jgi:preprotein translocase subunit SecE
MKPPTPPQEEEAPQAGPPPAPPEDLNPALSLKGAGGVPGLERLGPWFGTAGLFLREVREEFRKVSWPTRRQIMVETGVVILISTLLTLLVMGYDVVLTWAANFAFYPHQLQQ